MPRFYRSALPIFMTCLCLVFAYLDVAAQSPGLEWGKTYAAVGFAEETSTTMAIDGAGNMYLTGSFTGTVDFDPGPSAYTMTAPPANYRDAYVMKLDATGVFQWAVQMGGKGVDVGDAIAVNAAGDVFVTGRVRDLVDFDPSGGEFFPEQRDSVDGDVFVWKLNANRGFQWAIRIGGAPTEQYGIEVNAIALDAESNVHILGRFSNQIDFDAGAGEAILAPFLNDTLYDDDYYVLKLDEAGAFKWVRSFARTDHPAPNPAVLALYAHSLAIDATGNVYAVGGFEGTMDFDPGAPVFPLVSAGKADGFVCKLRDNGDFEWAKRIGAAENDVISDIAIGAGYIALTGHFSGTVDFDPGAGVKNLTPLSIADAFALKLDAATGNYISAVNFGGKAATIGGAAGRCIALDPTGNMYIGGIFNGTADFNPGILEAPLVSTGSATSIGYTDMYLVSLDPLGAFRWVWGAGNFGSYEFLFGLHAYTNGDLLVQGCFANTIDVDPCPAVQNLTSPDWTAPFLMKLNQDGCISSVDFETASPALSLAPNPATQGTTLRSTTDLSGSTIVIRDLLGSVVRDWKGLQHIPTASASFELPIDLHDLATGVYFVELISASGDVRTQTLIIE